jgi:hypothetical protein
LADLHFEVLKHPAYSPDLAPSAYHLFPNLKKHLRGLKFFTTNDAMSASAFYLDDLKKIEQQSKKFVFEIRWAMMNKYLCQTCS